MNTANDPTPAEIVDLPQDDLAPMAPSGTPAIAVAPLALTGTFRHVFADQTLQILDASGPDGETAFKARLKTGAGETIALWGRLPMAFRRKSLAGGMAVVQVDEGFLRGPELPGRTSLPISFLIDDLSPHYDPSQPSRLETLLATHDFDADPDLTHAARALADQMIALGVGSFSHGIRPRDMTALYGAKTRKRVLVLGHHPEARALILGNVHGVTNVQTVLLARREHPGAQIIYKPHPQYLAQARAACLAEMADLVGDTLVLDIDVPLAAALDGVDHVVTVTSLGGFEAALRGVPVTVLGAPFYAGWGITDDRAAPERRVRRLTAEQVLAAAYLLYPVYFDPLSNRTLSALDAVRMIAMGQAVEAEEDTTGAQDHILMIGRKLPGDLLSQLVPHATATLISQADANLPKVLAEHVATVRQVQPSARATVVVQAPIRASVQTLLDDNPVRVVRIDPGFVFGELDQPTPQGLSVLSSRAAPHYDATRPSDLEHLLATHDFAGDPGLLDRAARLRARLVETGAARFQLPRLAPTAEPLLGEKTGKRVLVIGHNPTDPATTLCNPRGYDNVDLVRLARREHPDAQIVFRPHPAPGKNRTEVIAALRAALRDVVIQDQKLPLADVLAEVDHVVTLASLGGFEAALHSLPVTTFGAPFYAGWGITDDRAAPARRQRHLTIDQVFAAAYLLYPAYYDPLYRAPTTLEALLDVMSAETETQLSSSEAMESRPVSEPVLPDRITVLLPNMANAPAIRQLLEDRTFKIIDLSAANAEATLQAHLTKTPWPCLVQTDITVGVRRALAKAKVKTMELDEGFLRSTSLPSKDVPSWSFALDDLAPHYSATQTSRLEAILSSHDFDADSDLMARARLVKERLVEAGLSKFNHLVPTNDLDSIYGAKTRMRVLVLGHNPKNRAATLANPKGHDNLALVKLTLREHPDAQVIFKPHPMDASSAETIKTILGECPDVLIPSCDLPIAQALETVDHVVTLASLGGFEAALRGIPVTTFGTPFYAGWGVTDDRAAPERRTRALNIDQVFAAAYILYSRYIDPLYREPTTIENVVDYLRRTRPTEPPEEHSAPMLIDDAKKLLRFGLAGESLQLLHIPTQSEPDLSALQVALESALLAREYASALDYVNRILLQTQSEQFFAKRASIRLKLGDFSDAPERDFRLAMAHANGLTATFYEYFSFLWERQPISENTLDQLDHILSRANATKDAAQVRIRERLRVLFAAMLNQVGSINRAVAELDRALASGATAEKFMYLRFNANRFKGSGYVTPFEKENFARLLKMDGSLEGLITSNPTSVCIVGNGPTELGTGNGKIIDSHDVVIRFNSYSTNFPESIDYGTKIDVWARMPFHPYVKSTIPKNPPLVIFSGINRLHRQYSEWHAILDLVAQGVRVQFFPARELYELQKMLGAPPTQGLVMCYLVYKYTGRISQDQCFGLSFAKLEAAGQSSYHYSDSTANSSLRHDWDGEAAIFQKMVTASLPKEEVIARHMERLELRTSRSQSEQPLISPILNSDDRTEIDFEKLLCVSPGLNDYELFGMTPEPLSARDLERHHQALSGKSSGRRHAGLTALENGTPCCFVGFGMARTGALAYDLAREYGMPYRLAEWGLISSMHLPSEKQFNFSLILDSKGIFYDTMSPSDIETILLEDKDIRSDAVRARARAMLDKVIAHNITKYNNSPDVVLSPIPEGRKRILVVDQTAGDNSIVYGQCSRYSFQDMLETALADPQADVLLKVHPEAVVGAKQGNFDLEAVARNPRVQIVGAQCNIVSMIKQVDEVYVMTSGVGLEALMVGKPVSCFGVPFYAGWGLTHDRSEVINPRRRLTIEELFAGVFFKYTMYFHPETRQPCDMETCIDWIIANLTPRDPLRM